jgi:hypothetical protein
VLGEINFVLVASIDDFVVNVRDVHAESHIVLKVVSHDPPDDIKANVSFGVSHM